MDGKKDGGLSDALFGREAGPESLADALFATRKQGGRPRGSKRPWTENLEECPACGSPFPAGGVCPGCGLHDEEMPWGRA